MTRGLAFSIVSPQEIALLSECEATRHWKVTCLGVERCLFLCDLSHEVILPEPRRLVLSVPLADIPAETSCKLHNCAGSQKRAATQRRSTRLQYL